MKIEIDTKQIEEKLEKKIKKDIKKDLIRLVTKFFDDTLPIEDKTTTKTTTKPKTTTKTTTETFPILATMESVQNKAEQIYNLLKDVYPATLTFPDIYIKLGISEASLDIKSAIAYPVNILVSNRLIEKTSKNYQNKAVPAYKWKKK